MGTVRRGINLLSEPKSVGCEECLATDGWWLHLRRCAECGHIGCCDSSPGQHAAKHAHSAGHPVVASFEPLQHWFFDYAKQDIVRGRRLLPPRCRPLEQASPGPTERVPLNWQGLLHEDV